MVFLSIKVDIQGIFILIDTSVILVRQKQSISREGFMIDHVKLLIVLANLLLGAGISVYIYQAYRRYGSPPLKPLFFQAVFFNCLVLLLLATKYSDINIGVENLNFPALFSMQVGLILVYFFLIGFSYASLGLYLAFLGKKFSRRLRRWVAASTLVFMAGILLEPFLAKGGLPSQVHYHIYENIGAIFLLLELGIMIALPIKAGRLKDRQLVKVVRTFSLMYISRYPFLILTAFIPQPFRLLIGLLVLNLVPLVWCRFIMEPYLNGLKVSAPVEVMDLQSIVLHYKLSPRETEILGLIMQGKSNREMEEDLFISYHTVKNHVYNIYRKLGVKTRFELLHMVSHSEN